MTQVIDSAIVDSCLEAIKMFRQHPKAICLMKLAELDKEKQATLTELDRASDTLKTVGIDMEAIANLIKKRTLQDISEAIQ